MIKKNDINPLYRERGRGTGKFHTLHRRVYFFMFFLAWKMHLFFSALFFENRTRGPPGVLHFRQITKWRTFACQNGARYRVKDFYKDAVGETGIRLCDQRKSTRRLADTFRKGGARRADERSADIPPQDGYTEGETEDLMAVDQRRSLEDKVIRQMDMEILQKAMQTLTAVQKERLHFYFFEGMTYQSRLQRKNSIQTRTLCGRPFREQ